MFTSLVVPAGGGDAGGSAAQVAAGLARLSDLPLELLRVEATGGDDVEWRADHGTTPVSRITVVADDVASAIADHARSRDGALVVMATSAAALVSGQRLSVAGEVLSLLAQPVLLVGPEARPHRLDVAPRLVVGVDHEHPPDSTAAAVASWLRTFGGPAPELIDLVAPASWPAGALDLAIDDARPDALRQALAAAGVVAHRRVLATDDPVAALLAVERELEDTVHVVTAERWDGGRSHWHRTVRRLVQRSTSPVLVVPADLAAHWTGAPPAAQRAGRDA